MKRHHLSDHHAAVIDLSNMDIREKTNFNTTSFKETTSVATRELLDSSFEIVDHVHYDLTPPSEPDEFGHDVVVVHQPSSPTKQPVVAVIGVGYVGQHLVDIFSKSFDVLGYDVSQTRVDQVKRQFKKNPRARFTSCSKEIGCATHFLIAVPTLLLPDKKIDSSYLHNALKTVATQASPGSTIVIESSVAVGMTRGLLGPLAQEKRFFAGMSPERVDPGRVTPPAHAIPKIISGLDDLAPGSLDTIQWLYSKVFDNVVPVSSPEVAEMAKLYENCQRMVCIAYANEMADACGSHGIDPFEVCRAAKTKPFGYMAFVPGVGVGGHCIPVNPHYLLSNNSFPVLQAASERMSSRPSMIARRIVDGLCDAVGPACRRSLLVVGMGFKLGQSHLANSPGLELARCLVLTEKVDVVWADPLVPQTAVPQIAKLKEAEWSETFLDSRFDVIVVVLKQYGLNFSVLRNLRSARVEMLCP